MTLEQVFRDGSRQFNLSCSDREAFKALEANGILTGITATTWADAFEVGDGASTNTEGSRLRVSLVTGDYFSVLGVKPQIGRMLADDDDRDNGDRAVLVMSDGFWARRFGRARDVVGRAMTVSGTTYTIIGVASRPCGGDWIGWPTDVWVPSAHVADILNQPGAGQLRQRLQYKLRAPRARGVTRTSRICSWPARRPASEKLPSGSPSARDGRESSDNS